MRERMTAEEIAAQFYDEFEDNNWFSYNAEVRTYFIERFAKAIDQACAEAAEDFEMREQIQHNFYMVAIEQRDRAYENGFTDAREAAANVAESYLMIGAQMNPQFPQIARNVGEQIRALQPSPETEGL